MAPGILIQFYHYYLIKIAAEGYEKINNPGY